MFDRSTECSRFVGMKFVTAAFINPDDLHLALETGEHRLLREVGLSTGCSEGWS